MTAKPVLVYGASVFGQVLRQLIVDCGRQFGGFVDDWNSGGEIIGGFSDVESTISPSSYDFIIGIGYKHLEARRIVADRLQSAGFALPAFVHPRAYVSSTASIGPGSVIMTAAVIDSASSVGPLCVLWPGSILNHHSVLDENCFLSPGSIVCGNSRVGPDCFLGAGAVVVDGVAVPTKSFVKAGAVYSDCSVERPGSTRQVAGVAAD